MKVILFCIAFCAILSRQNQFEIGQPLNEKIKEINLRNHFILTSAGSIEKASTVIYNKCKFDLILYYGRRIKSIFTRDKRFETPDYIRVGMSFETIKDKLDTNQPHFQSGWATYYDSLSGWKIAFDFNKPVNGLSKVIFIFKS